MTGPWSLAISLPHSLPGAEATATCTGTFTSVETSKFSVHFPQCICVQEPEFYRFLQATGDTCFGRRGPLGFLKIQTSLNGCASLDLIFVEILISSDLLQREIFNN